MSFAELLFSQLLDPFRIGLLLALVFTARNTAGVTGVAVPLILGGAFVAVLIPVSMQSASVAPATAILTGLVANAVLVGIILMMQAGWRRLTAPGRR